MRWLALVVALLVFPSAAFAACEGRDWRDELAPETMREIRARAAAVPFHEGIAFEALRGETRLTLFGTVHLTDPRVFVPDEIAARIRAADLLLVEVTRDLFAEFERKLAEDVTLLFNFAGPDLKSRLAAHEWETLQSALSALGVEPEQGNRMRPWFVSFCSRCRPARRLPWRPAPGFSMTAWRRSRAAQASPSTASTRIPKRCSPSSPT